MKPKPIATDWQGSYQKQYSWCYSHVVLKLREDGTWECHKSPGICSYEHCRRIHGVDQ